MAGCYLFANYEVQYKCEYILKKEFIEVDIIPFVPQMPEKT